MAPISFGQNVLELLPGSKSLEYDEKTGAQKLLGGANFIYQNNKLFCDSAYYFDQTNQLYAYGHVHFNKEDQLNLYCDSLKYSGKTGLTNLWGNVRAIEDEYALTTDSMIYDTKSKVGIYRYGGKVVNPSKQEVLTSRIGYFYPYSKNFTFKGQVDYKSPDLKMITDTLKFEYNKNLVNFYGPTTIWAEESIINCERGWYNVESQMSNLYKNAKIRKGSEVIQGDTLKYDSELKVSQGLGNVIYYDTTKNTSFSGDYALINDSLNYSLLTGHALVIQKQKEDTIYIHAGTFFNQNDSLGNRVLTKGYYKVRIFGNKIKGRADSLSLDSVKMELFESPILWSENGELKGDSITVFMNDSIIHRVEIKQHATVLMEVDSGLYYNQIGGKSVTAFMKNNELHQAIANGNAQTIFFPTNEEKSDSLTTIKRMGMNRLYASDLKVYLDSGEVTGITYFEQPDGVFYPMDKIDSKEQFIQNFELNFHLRPETLEAIFEEDQLSSASSSE